MSGLTDDARKRIANELSVMMGNRMRLNHGEVEDAIAILAEAMIGAHATVSASHGIAPEVAAANCAAIVTDHYPALYAHHAAALRDAGMLPPTEKPN